MLVPAHPICVACDNLFKHAADRPWTKRGYCSCGAKLPHLKGYTFTYSNQTEEKYFIGQCEQCKRLHWDDYENEPKATYHKEEKEQQNKISNTKNFLLYWTALNLLFSVAALAAFYFVFRP